MTQLLTGVWVFPTLFESHEEGHQLPLHALSWVADTVEHTLLRCVSWDGFRGRRLARYSLLTSPWRVFGQSPQEELRGPAISRRDVEDQDLLQNGGGDPGSQRGSGEGPIVSRGFSGLTEIKLLNQTPADKLQCLVGNQSAKYTKNKTLRLVGGKPTWED